MGFSIKVDKNDALFSKMIRERDKERCIFGCGRSAENGYKMTNSHYWGRGNKTVRFLGINCDTLCFLCHSENEGNKQGYYRRYKISQLGEEEHAKLERLANETGKYGAFEKDLLYGILKEDYANKVHLTRKWGGYILKPGKVIRV